LLKEETAVFDDPPAPTSGHCVLTGGMIAPQVEANVLQARVAFHGMNNFVQVHISNKWKVVLNDKDIVRSDFVEGQPKGLRYVTPGFSEKKFNVGSRFKINFQVLFVLAPPPSFSPQTVSYPKPVPDNEDWIATVRFQMLK
jgi:hypothetical protein